MLTSSGQEHGGQQSLEFSHFVGGGGNLDFGIDIRQKMAHFAKTPGIYPVGIPGEYYIDIEEDRDSEATMELGQKGSSLLLLPSVTFEEPG